VLENSRFARFMPVVAIIVLALNLRPVAVSVGPVLAEISADIGLSPGMSGFLTSLPTLCFAVFGAIAPWVGARLGPHVAIGVAFVALVLGQALRPFADGPLAFFGLSVVALAGMALANVLIPPLVRLHYPNRVGLGTALYSLAISIGVTISSAVTVPLAQATGGWRGAMVGWAVVALASLVVWAPMLRFRERGGRRSTASLSVLTIGRTKLGWALAIMFGLQSGSSYTVFGWLPSIFRSYGMSEVDAGLMLGIATGVGIPLAFIVPAYVARTPRPTGIFLVMMGCLAAGWLGLLLAPMAAPWLWSILLALGTSTFPMILALFATRALTPSTTAALSGFTQSVGYLFATVCPILFGSLNGWTGSWSASLILMLVLTVPFTITGLYASQPRVIEDQLS
jgi:MFS transporter, CP family, cyanate transporter